MLKYAVRRPPGLQNAIQRNMSAQYMVHRGGQMDAQREKSVQAAVSKHDFS